MKSLSPTSVLTMLLTTVSACANPASTTTGSATAAAGADLVVTRAGSQPSAKGSNQYFTGVVRVDVLNAGKEPSRTASAYVTFEPGARTAWHTHPVGQTLIVTAGAGLVQSWGSQVAPIRPGDVVWIPPGVKHWHGASPTTSMTHIAITEQVGGKNVDWLEHVSDEQYGK